MDFFQSSKEHKLTFGQEGISFFCFVFLEGEFRQSRDLNISILKLFYKRRRAKDLVVQDPVFKDAYSMITSREMKR